MSMLRREDLAETPELPRTVPQDPEAVRNEQEVRQATAEALRASQVGRGPSPDELANLRKIEAEDPRPLRPPPSIQSKIESLEDRIEALERIIKAEYGEDALEPLADGWPR